MMSVPGRMLLLFQVIFYLTALGLVSSQDQENIKLVIDPPISLNGKLRVPVGSPKLITCRADVPKPELISDMKWYWDTNAKTQVHPVDGKIELIEGNEHGSLGLFFNSVQKTELGIYRCTATYANTKFLEEKFELGTFLPITFENAEKNQYATKNEEYKVKCSVKSDPIAGVIWKKDHRSITYSDHYVQDQDGLIIKQVTEADEGVYECRATVQELGDVKSEYITLQVQEKPVITSIVKEIEGVEGESVHMKCTGTGKPTPEVEWIHEGRNLYGTERHVVDKYLGTLQINELHKDDRGRYNCRLRNLAGDDEAFTELIIVTKPIVEEFINVTSQVNEKAVLVCKARGNPPPDIVFQKDSRHEPFGQGSQLDARIYQEQTRNGEVTTATLTINDLLRTDDGLYNCIASNRRARTEKMGHLTVEFPPTFESTTMNEAWSWDGKAANLTCFAEAIPNATIAWYFAGTPDREILEGPNVRRYGLETTSTLEIRPLGHEYFGHYTCVATNKISKAQHTIQFKEARKPGPIRQVFTKALTATSVSFQIAAPPDNGGLPIDSYVIQYKPERDNWENPTSKSWPIEEQLITIEGLEPTRTYSFRFAARSQVGVGEYSQERLELMPKRAAPEPPLILGDLPNGIAYTPYSNRAEIKWSSPQDNGERVDTFKISYIPVRNGSSTWESYGSNKEDIVASDTLFHNIHDLLANTFYQVEIRAHNVLGWGEPSRLIIKTAPPSNNRSYDSMKSAHTNAIALPLIIAISVTALLITLIIVDFACCHINQRGIMYAVSTKMCTEKKGTAGSEISKGSTNGEKQPYRDDVLDHGFMNPEDIPTHQPLIADGSGKVNGSHGHGSTNTMV